MNDCSVEYCSSPAVTRGWCNRHYIRWQRHGSVEDRPDALTRYWSKIDRSSPDDCWPWIGGVDKDGYGKFSVGYSNFRSTRWGYETLVGPIPNGMSICHSCDNPRCHRPDHWFLGTPGDNARDRDTKGRQAAGERHGMARLTREEVEALRRDGAHGLSSRALAVKYGVSKSQALRIIRGESWR